MARALAGVSEGARTLSLEQIAVYWTCGAIVLAPLVFGGVFAWSVLVIALLSVVSGVLTIAAHARSELRKATSPVLLALFGVVVFTALQAIPLPIGLLEWLSEGAAGAHRGAAEVLSGSATLGTLSYDPGATHSKIVEWSSLATMFTAAWIHSAAGRRRTIRKAVAISALVLAAVTALHFVLALDHVYGVYEPVHASRRLVGPLVNENNFGGFLLLGPFVMLALAQDSGEHEKRRLWYAGAAFVVVMIVLSLSRGAFLGLAAGSTLVLVSFLRRRHRGRRATLITISTLVLGAGVSIALYLASGRILALFDRQGFEKLDVIARGLGLALEHPFVGVGRGGFSAAFAQRHGTTVRYEHAENWFVDGAAEWGFPVMIGLAAAIGVGIWQRRSNLRSDTGFAAFIAIVAVLVHNLVDFGLELQGVALPFVALLATLLAPRSQPAELQAASWSSMSIAAPLVVGSGALALVGLGWLLPMHDPIGLRTDLESAIEAGDREAFGEILESAVRAHPAEPVFPLLAASEAVRHDDPRAPRWLNRAMILAPHWWSPHALAANWLERRGRTGQAALELREAAELDPILSNGAACQFLLRNPREELLDRVVPRGAQGVELLSRLTRCRELAPDLLAAVDERLSARDPEATGPLVRAARRALEDGEPDRALEIAAQVLARDPHNGDAVLLRARVLEERGQADDATRELEAASSHAEKPAPLMRLRAEIFARQRNTDEMRRALDDLRGHVSSRPAALADMEAYRGRLERECGNPARAVAAYEEAYSLDPKPQYLRQVARVAEESGDLASALSAYTRLLGSDPHDARYQRALDRVERRIRENSL